MIKMVIKSAVAGMVLLSGLSPVLAQAELEAEMMCAIETMGEPEAEALSRILGSPGATATDAQAAPLQRALKSCTAKHGWSKEDSDRFLQFNFSMLSALGLDEKLSARGVDSASYETVLDGKSADEMEALLSAPETSPIMRAAMDRLKSEQGNNVSAETAGWLAAYLVHVTEAQLVTMDLMGLDF